MRSHRALLAASVLVLWVGAPPPPAGAVRLSGTLAPVPGAAGCLRDRGRLDPAGLHCAQPVEALLAPSALTVSPDGRSVYVVAAESGSVVTLARRPGGGLAPPVHPGRRDCVQQSGFGDCAAGSPGLAGADAVLVSPDGRDVYVGSADAAALVVFRRGQHGLLFHPGLARGKKKLLGATCLHGREVVPHAAGRCAGALAPLQRVSALAISPDGRFLYALSSGNDPGQDTLVALRRQADGTLTPRRGCIASHGGDRKRPVCPSRATGLRGASAVTISPDGQFLYVAAGVSSAVSAYRRNSSTGAVTPLRGAGSCVAEPGLSPAADSPGCPSTAAGLRGARALVVSPDGRRVYVAGFDPGSLVVLDRNPQSGGLFAHAQAPDACLLAGPGQGCSAGLEALRGASAIAISRPGDRLFVAAQGADATFDLRLTNGLPTLPLTPFASSSPLGGPQAIAISPDGRNVYIASPADDEVAALNT